MLPDLEHLIHLQNLETRATDAREQLAAHPTQLEEIDARVRRCTEQLEATQARLDEHRAARQSLENDLATVQARLSKFKDQLMAVKTNKEYQAMQSEIATSETEVKRLEDRILEHMVESDDLAADVAQAKAALAAEKTKADADRRGLERNRERLEQQLTTLDVERASATDQLTPSTRALFDILVRQRKGLAVAEAKDGHCTSCRVRLRPQLFNDIRLNERLIQCETCQRILYFAEQPREAG